VASAKGGRRPAALGRWSPNEPLARVSATGVSATDPRYFGLAPVQAVNRALAKAGKGLDDLSVLELNVAFAAEP
jgi:acetyl-CoA acyltransferase